MAPGLIFGRSITGTSGGRMLETFTRLMLPMPAARSALSKALRVAPTTARQAAEGARGERRAAHPRRSASGEKRARATRSALGERHRAGSETAFGRFAAIAAPAKPAPSRTFFLQWQKTDHTVTSVLLAAKNFSTRRCSEQRRSDSSQERCGRWTDRTKEGQWIERPGTAPAARVVRLRL